MSKSEKLIPPVEAPLPWTYDHAHSAIIDATGAVIDPIGLVAHDDEHTVANYLIAAANEAPGLVADREKLRTDLEHVHVAAMHEQERTSLALDAAYRKMGMMQARMEEMEELLARQALVVEAARRQQVARAQLSRADDDREWLDAIAKTERAVRVFYFTAPEAP